MKKLLLGSIGFASLIASGAWAADLPMKAPPIGRMEADPWTGFYLGANVGYGVAQTRETSANAILTGALAGFTDTTATRNTMSGVIGGGQIGWNWRLAPSWIWGFETDFQGADQRSTVTGTSFSSPAAGLINTTTTTGQDKIDWFGTVRGRAGYVWGNTLWYGTGGLAYGHISVNQAASRLPGFAGVPGGSSLSGAGSVTQTRTGWTVGAGTETKLWGGWTAKLEYLYVDLGSVNNAFTIFNPATGTAASNFSSRASFRDNIVRVGLNYKLGGGY